jgi:hypothetical protein
MLIEAALAVAAPSATDVENHPIQRASQPPSIICPGLMATKVVVSSQGRFGNARAQEHPNHKDPYNHLFGAQRKHTADAMDAALRGSCR